MTMQLVKWGLAGALLAMAGCSEESNPSARPRLLSVEAARVEDLSALERMGIELAAPMPARFVIEPCVAQDAACASLPKNADRID